MEEKGAYLHGKYIEIESLVKIGGFYRDMAYAGSSYLQAYRDENAAMFDAYEQEYKDKKLYTVHRQSEHRISPVRPAAKRVQHRGGLRRFFAERANQGDPTVRHLDFSKRPHRVRFENIERTAQVYAGPD